MTHEDPPPPPILQAVACDALPAEAFLIDVAWNFLGVDPSASPPGASVDDDLFEELGLGALAPKVATLDAEIRAGRLDLVAWPSLNGLSPGDAERTLVAAAILLDPELELRCEYLRYLPEGRPRSVLEVALLVNESHGRPLPDSAVISQPFEKKSLSYEIACAAQQALGFGPCPKDETEVETDAQAEPQEESPEDPNSDACGDSTEEHHASEDQVHGGACKDSGADEKHKDHEEHEDPADTQPASAEAFGPNTILESPVVQLYAALRGAQRAQWRGDSPAQVSGPGGQRPWAYRPFNRSQARFDLLLALIGRRPDGAGLIGPGGGVVQGEGPLAGARLEVPAGALAEETAIAFVFATDGPPQTGGRVPAGPAAELIPQGLVFMRPVTLRLPYWPDLARTLRMLPGGAHLTTFDPIAMAWTPITTNSDDPRLLAAEIEHFSFFQGAFAASPDLIAGTEVAELKRPSTGPSWDLYLSVKDPAVAVVPAGSRTFWLTQRIRFSMSIPPDLLPPITDLRTLINGVPTTVTDRTTGEPIRKSFIGTAQALATLTDTAANAFILVAATDDTGHGRVYLVSVFPDGTARTNPVAGTGTDIGEAVAAASARLFQIVGLAVDTEQNIYVAEAGTYQSGFVSRIRRINSFQDPLAPGQVNTVAGALTSGFNGEGDVETAGTAMLLDIAIDVGTAPSAALVMSGQLLFIADARNNRIRALNVHPTDDAQLGPTLGLLTLHPGQIATVIGTGAIGAQGCSQAPVTAQLGSAARDTRLFLPGSVVLTDQDLLIAEPCYHRVLVMPLTGPAASRVVSVAPLLPVTLLAGTGAQGNTGDGGPSVDATLWSPSGLSYDDGGYRVLVASGQSVRFISFADQDRDGVGDSVDNCLLLPNPGQEDADGDGLGDACDSDPDADGIGLAVDNCPLVPNPDQADLNGDGYGDACEPNADGDGVPAAIEAILGTDPALPDTDGDGFGDGAEIAADSDPTRASSTPNDPISQQRVRLWYVSIDLPFDYRFSNVGSGDGLEGRDHLSGSLKGGWLLYLPIAAPAAGVPPPQGIPVRPDLITAPAPFVSWEGGDASCTRVDTSGPKAKRCELTVLDRSVDIPLPRAAPPPAPPLPKILSVPGFVGWPDATGQDYFVQLIPKNSHDDLVVEIEDQSLQLARWATYTKLASMRDPRIPCASPNADLPVIATLKERQINGTEAFKIPIHLGQAALDCAGTPLDADARLQIKAGVLHFQPIYVSKPEDIQNKTNRNANSQFTFDAQPVGELAIAHQLVLPMDPRPLALLTTKVRWDSPAIGNNIECTTTRAPGEINVCWTDPWTDPGATALQGRGVNPTVTYRGLPPNNADFGSKLLQTQLVWEETDPPTDILLDAINYEVFFDRFAFNWPTTSGLEPNWYFYQLQVMQPAVAHSYEPSFDPASHNPVCEVGMCWEVYYLQSNFSSFNREIFFFPNGGGFQLLPFAAAVVHENRHDTFWGLLTYMWAAEGCFQPRL